MPPLETQQSGKDDLEVLLTGFGPFSSYSCNPSWLSVKDLHNTYLSTDKPPPDSSSSSSSSSHSETEQPRIHIQVIQCPVSYSHVLSVVPLIHGLDPSAPEARAYVDPRGDQPDPETRIGPQGNGLPFPEGYPVQLPKKGKFDLVLHVGVGSMGAMEIEKLGHKRGYQIPDVKGEKAPITTDQSTSFRREAESSEAEKREEARSGSDKGPPGSSSQESRNTVRGFGKGYEQFQEEEINSNDVTGLVEWLQQECHVKNIRESNDAGRYLCDFIYYCSLCETKRKGAGTKVQFVHVPPTDEPQSTIECQETIQKIIWWLLCRDKFR